MAQEQITIAQDEGVKNPKHVLSLTKPRPKWLVNTVAGCVWVTGAWVALGISGVLQTWEVPLDLIHKLDVTMPVATAIFSALSRFIGIEGKNQ